MTKENSLKQLKEKAFMLAKEKNWGEEAIKVNKNIINLDPKCSDAYTRLAKCYKEAKRDDLAFKLYKKVLSFDKENIIAKNNYEELRNKFEVHNIMNNQKKFDYLQESAAYYFKNGDDRGLITVGDKIVNLLTKSINVNSTGYNYLCKQVVSAYLNSGSVNQAIEWLDQVSSVKYDVPQLRHQLLEIKNTQKDLEIKDITDTYTLNRLAVLHKKSYAYKKALHIYSRSKELDNSNYYTYNGIAGICRRIGLFDEAIEIYKEGYKLQPNIASLTGLGAVCRAKGKHEEALNYYKQALNIDELSHHANNGIGAVYFDLGKYELGSKYFMVTATTEDLLELFEEYKSKNRLDAALECLNLLLKKNPNHRKANFILNKYSREKKY